MLHRWRHEAVRAGEPRTAMEQGAALHDACRQRRQGGGGVPRIHRPQRSTSFVRSRGRNTARRSFSFDGRSKHVSYAIHSDRRQNSTAHPQHVRGGPMVRILLPPGRSLVRTRFCRRRALAGARTRERKRPPTTRPHRYGGIFLGWLANAASPPAAPEPFSTLFYLPNRSVSRAPAPKSSPTARSQKSRRGAQT